ncbi:methionyl-tRNA formyltransferase [Lachnospiraceae bacterium]|nr:methionyl-tRNA formyltransferase [Lachnospiraceae bacterium]
MNAIFCCADKEVALRGVKYLKEKGVDILCCLISKIKDNNSLFSQYCKDNKIEIYNTETKKEIIRKYSDDSIDLLISFTYPLKLEEEIICKAKCPINFHPAPLPEYRGCGTPCQGILNGEKEWGVTCHYLDKNLDTGNIIAIKKFEIEENKHYTGMDLSKYSWEVCYKLLCDIVDKYTAGIELEASSQSGGNYYSKKYLEQLKEIKVDDSAELILKKVRALWYPPFEGAYILLDGKKFYLIDKEILESYNALIQKRDKFCAYRGEENDE